MLSSKDRINLRNELFEKLKDFHIIYESNKSYRFTSKKNFIEKINNFNLREKYDLYINQFRSENEALYCLLHLDDFENHKCPICNEICEFYYNKQHKEYRNTCGSKTCGREQYEKTNLKLHGNKNYNNREKAKETCKKEYGVEHTSKLSEVIEKGKDTKNKRYGDSNYNNRDLSIKTCNEKYGVPHHMQNEKIKKNQHKTMLSKYGTKHALQVDEFKNKSILTYHKNHDFQDIINDEDVINIIQNLKLQKESDLHLDIYYNDKYFKEFIIELSRLKNRKLQLNEIVKIFGRSRTTIKEKLQVLDLLDYFEIKDSELELKFYNFLIENGFVEETDFDRHNRSILLENQLELDFYLKDYDIAFEINDLQSHNVKQKDQYYHYNKTIECAKKGIYLIHIWEWELTDEKLWRRTSNWILNLLNQSKIQLDIKDCSIKEISVEEYIKFHNEYSISQHIQVTHCIGLYHNNELIEILSFQNDILDVVVKFGYDPITNIQNIIESYMIYNNLDSLIMRIDISKMNINNIKFELLKHSEPEEISCNNEYKKMYDCGKNIYIFKRN